MPVRLRCMHMDACVPGNQTRRQSLGPALAVSGQLFGTAISPAGSAARPRPPNTACSSSALSDRLAHAACVAVWNMHATAARHLPLLVVSQPVAFAHRRCGAARSTTHAKLQEPSALRRRGRRIDCGPSWRWCRRFNSADGLRQTASWAPFHSAGFGLWLLSPRPTRPDPLT